MHSSEVAGAAIVVAGRTVRGWARDFLSEVQIGMVDGASQPKQVYTFSPYSTGGHTEWLLSDEGLQRKARLY